MRIPVNGWSVKDKSVSPHCRRYGPAPVVHIVIVFILILLMSLPARAENVRSYVEVSGGYTTGDFGTPTKYNLNYLSSTVGHVTPDYDFSITVPYLSLSNKTGSQSQTENGFGDVILRVGRVFVHEGASGLSLDGALAVKIPTADEMKGLGTGETDLGAVMGLHQRLGGFKGSLYGGYIKVGDPPRVNYNDVYLYGTGISKIFGFTEFHASFEGRRSIIPAAKDPQEFTVGFFHVLNADYAVKGSTFIGLNNGGPDLGISLGLVRWF